MTPADPSAAAMSPHALTELVEAVRQALGTPPAELLDLEATMAFTGQSRSSVYRGMSEGTFPRSVDTPSGKRWRRTKDLIPWINRLS